MSHRQWNPSSGARSGRLDYVAARLRAQDEARSAELEKDDRVWRPDPDEETERPCGARGSAP